MTRTLCLRKPFPFSGALSPSLAFYMYISACWNHHLMRISEDLVESRSKVWIGWVIWEDARDHSDKPTRPIRIISMMVYFSTTVYMRCFAINGLVGRKFSIFWGLARNSSWRGSAGFIAALYGQTWFLFGVWFVCFRKPLVLFEALGKYKT